MSTIAFGPRSFILAAALLVGLSPGNLPAQLNLLSVHEAACLVERAPDVEQARSEGRCPGVEVNYNGDVTLLIKVRGNCPDPNFESQLVGNYTVNRRTGLVKDGESGPPLHSVAMDLLRRELLEAASHRMLSSEESECLAVKAVNTSRATHAADVPFAVTQVRVGEEDGPEFMYIAARDLRAIHASISRFLIVERATGLVRDYETGTELSTPDLWSLRAKMFAIRFPPLLSLDDVAELAVLAPPIAARIARGCSALVSAASGNADGPFVGLTCPSQGADEAVLVAVNLRTGKINDPRTGKDVGTPETERTAKRILVRLDEALSNEKAEVRRACGTK